MMCKVECTCDKCENLITNEPIVFIRQYGLDEFREFHEGVKCLKYGMYALSVDQLKTSNQLDDFIYID